MTLLVEFLTGPGVGKSTTKGLAFGGLKFRGQNIEEISEFAKDLTWEKRVGALGFQPYIFGKQAFKFERLRGQVDAVLSDTSLLLSLLYKPDPLPSWYPAFEQSVLAYYNSLDVLTIFLERDPLRTYNPKGRNQTEEQAKEIDAEIKDVLTTNAIPFIELPVDSREASHVDEIIRLVEERIG